jgi:hypothetical protein
MPISKAGCQSAPKDDYHIESASVAAARAVRAARTAADADITRNLRTRRKPNSRYQDSTEEDEDHMGSGAAAAAAIKRQKVRYAADIVNGMAADEDEMAAAAAVMAQMAEAGTVPGGKRRVRPGAALSSQLPPEMARQRVEIAVKPPGLYTGDLLPTITYGKTARVQPLLPVVPAGGQAGMMPQRAGWQWMQQQGAQGMPPGGGKPGAMGSGGMQWQGQGPQGGWGQQPGHWAPKQEYSSGPPPGPMQPGLMAGPMMGGPGMQEEALQAGHMTGQQGMGPGQGYGPNDGYNEWGQDSMGPPTQHLGPGGIQYNGPRGPAPGEGGACGVAVWPDASHDV